MKALAIALLIAVSPAAQIQNGAVTGDVRDQDGGVIPGADVSITSQATSATVKAYTNARGQFRFENLAEGKYQVAVTISGFKTSRRTVDVRPASSVTSNFDLQIGSLVETVMVSASGVPTNAARPAPAITQPRAATAPVEAPSPVRAVNAPGLPIRVGGSIMEPKKVSDVRPVFPADAQAAGLGGTVIIEATIDTEGAVKNMQVLRGVPDAPSLDQAALTAVSGWRYTPTKLNGRPVEVAMTVTISFTLR